MAEEFKVLVGAELKSDAIQGIRDQINGMPTINLKMNTGRVRSQLTNIRKQIEKLSGIKITLTDGSGVGAGNSGNAIKNTVNSMNVAYKQMLTMQRKISSIKLQIGGLDSGKNGSQITELRKQLRQLEDDYKFIQQTFSQSNLSTDQWVKLQTVISSTEEKLDVLKSKVADTKAQLAQDISLKLDNGTINNDFSQLDASLSKIRTKSNAVTQGMQELNAALTDMKTAKSKGDVDGLISSYDRYEAALKKVKNQIDINARAERQNADTAKLNAAKQALATQMDVWLQNNSAAAKQFGSQIEALKAQISSCDATQLDGLKAEFKEVTKQAQLAGKATQTFGDRLSTQMSKLGIYFSASMIITQGVRAMQSMYDNVVEVDTAMTGLYRVTDLTSEQYAKLYDNMISSAKKYGSTLSDLVTSTADWVRLGFDSSTANRLSEITAMYQHISDLDNGTAVENLVTAYKGFQDQLLTMYDGDSAAAIEYVADIFNELGNKFAVSAEDVGAALTNSASALSLAGNTIQQTAAMATGITEVTQNPDKAGNSLKVLSLRLRGMKGELQELGEEVDENVESLSKMQTQVLNLTDGKVNIFNDDGSFKSTYEIMDGIAEIYNDLDPTKQADLLETIAGKNRANDVAALIKNWKQVEAAMSTAMEAEGSAAAENAKYMESVQGHLDSLAASWQALANTAIESGFVTDLLDGITSLINGLDIVIEKVGVLPTLFSGIAAYASFKNVGELIKQFHYPITLGNEYAHKALY